MAVKALATVTLGFMVDIKSTTTFYKLQASTLSKPSKPTTKEPSGWTTTEPSYSEGSTNTLYFVDRTIFTNEEFSYSEVSVSSSYEAAKLAYNKALSATNTANDAKEIAEEVRDKKYCEIENTSIVIEIEHSTKTICDDTRIEYVEIDNFLNEQNNRWWSGYIVRTSLYTNIDIFTNYATNTHNVKITPIHVSNGIVLLFDRKAREFIIIFSSWQHAGTWETSFETGDNGFLYRTAGYYTYTDGDYIEFNIEIDGVNYPNRISLSTKEPRRRNWYVDPGDYNISLTSERSFTTWYNDDVHICDLIIYKGMVFEVALKVVSNRTLEIKPIPNSEIYKYRSQWNMGREFSAYGWGDTIYIPTYGMESIVLQKDSGFSIYSGTPSDNARPTTVTIAWNGGTYVYPIKEISITNGHVAFKVATSSSNNNTYSGWSYYSLAGFFNKDLIIV